MPGRTKTTTRAIAEADRYSYKVCGDNGLDFVRFDRLRAVPEGTDGRRLKTTYRCCGTLNSRKTVFLRKDRPMSVLDIVPPYDTHAESAAIGAAILKAEDIAWLRAYTRRARGRDFFDCLKRWTWERLKWYASRGRPPLLKWWQADGVFDKFEETFRPKPKERLPLLIVQWINAGFWWHADYHLDIVLAKSKARWKIETALKQLHEAIAEGTNK